MTQHLTHSLRLIRIGWTLARYDTLRSVKAIAPGLYTLSRFVPGKHRQLREGQRISLALQALGPSFIKLGQALSTRGDLIGDALARDLTELQDRLPPFSSALARQMVEEQLGAPIATLFAQFDDAPVAAASISQVHFAQTLGGHDVAVKILRPMIERAFARDLQLFFWIARMVEQRLPQYRRLKPVAMIQTFADTVRIELDLRMEAAAADELRENSKNDTDFYVPRVEWDLTAKRVLTTERICGISAGDSEVLKNAGINLDATMRKASAAFFNQVFRDGFFHADMHPGNLFVLPDGRLAPVDFGIMGRIDRTSQLILAQILWGFLKGDYHRVAELHHEAGYIPRHISIDLFAQAVRAVGAPIMGKATHEISVGKLFGQLLTIAEDFEMEAQPHLLLLQKTMLTAEGVGRGLNPHLNMWEVTEPLIKAWADKHFSPRARIKAYAEEAAEGLRDTPRMLREMKVFLEQVERQGVTVSAASIAQLETARAARQEGWLRLAWCSWVLAVATSVFFIARAL